MRRPGNNPKRRIAPVGQLGEEELALLAERVRHAGSGHHKRNPADYGLERTNPRPTKSLCDLLRIVPPNEAKALILKGVVHGMFSDFFYGEFPKFIWCVDADGEVYEAKTDSIAPGVYHGYRVEEDDNMRDYIKLVWKQRCPPVGP